MRPPVAALRNWWAMPAPKRSSVRSCSWRRTWTSYWPSCSDMRLIETARSRISSSWRQTATGWKSPRAMAAARSPSCRIGRTKRWAKTVVTSTTASMATTPAISAG